MTARRRAPILPTGRLDRFRRASARWFRERRAHPSSEGSFLRRRWNGRRLRARRLFVVAGLGWMLYLLIAGEHGLLAVRALESQQGKLQQQIDSVGDEVQVLRDRLEAEPGDPFFVERVARERYGLARENEVVYQLSLASPNDEDDTSLTPPEADGRFRSP